MIPIKTKQEIEIMRQGGKILAQIVNKLKAEVKEGISCAYLDKAAQALVFDFKARPAFKGYIDEKGKNKKPFPAALCVSVNDVVVHGVPNDYILKAGDIVGLDLGINYKGYFVDMAITELLRGQTLQETELAEKARLLRVAKKALKFGIAKSRAGNTFEDIGNTIQRYVESQGFGVIRELCGHGIGKALHEEPSVPNYGKRGRGEKIAEGMCFCIEPMIAMGAWKLIQAPDGFGYKTKDDSPTAHFEHTLAIVNGIAEVLTKP